MTQIRREHKETPKFQGNIVSHILGEMLTIVGIIVSQILSVWKQTIFVATYSTMPMFPFGNNGIFIIHASTVVASG
jgi:membrane-bound metal-dependent hydrolase YbcI (DUF457 family)